MTTLTGRHRSFSRDFPVARDLSNLFSASRLLLARLAGAGAGFLTQIVLARLLPPQDLGLFFAATSFAAVAGLVLTQGYPGILQRFITRYRERRRACLLAGFVWQVQSETVVLTIAMTLFIGGAGVLWPGLSSDQRLVAFSTALATAAAASLTIYNAAASVERRFELAQFPETLIRPIAFLPLVFVLDRNWIVSAGTVTVLYAGLTALLAVAQYIQIAPALPAASKAASSRVTRRWRAEALLSALAMLFATSFADLAIVLASPFLGPAGLAPFGIVLKVSLLVGFAVQVAHQVALPDLAEAYERKDAAKIARSLWQATAFPAVITTLALIAAMFGGERFLLLFGPEYVSAHGALLILLVAQLLRAAAGPSQSLLMLKGDQAANAAICVACTAILLMANAALVPIWRIHGASIAVLLTVAVWFGASARMLVVRHGLRVDLPYLVGRYARN